MISTQSPHSWPFVWADITGGFPSQRASNVAFWCCCIVSLINNLLNKLKICRWFDAPRRSHDVILISIYPSMLFRIWSPITSTISTWSRVLWIDSNHVTKAWNAICWNKTFKYWFKFHWSITQRIQQTILQHWSALTQVIDWHSSGDRSHITWPDYNHFHLRIDRYVRHWGTRVKAQATHDVVKLYWHIEKLSVLNACQ